MLKTEPSVLTTILLCQAQNVEETLLSLEAAQRMVSLTTCLQFLSLLGVEFVGLKALKYFEQLVSRLPPTLKSLKFSGLKLWQKPDSGSVTREQELMCQQSEVDRFSTAVVSIMSLEWLLIRDDMIFRSSTSAVDTKIL